MTQDVLEIKPGGNFLSRKSTRTMARSDEFLLASLLDRHTLDQWLQLGKPSMYSNARKKVDAILAQPLQDPLPEDISSKLDDLLRKADAELE